MRLVSRHGVDHTRRYPDVAEAIASLSNRLSYLRPNWRWQTLGRSERGMG
jgi:hypothetical protein